MKYKLSEIKWFKIKDEGYLPFILNGDNTKIKILTTGDVLSLIPAYLNDRILLSDIRRGNSQDHQCMYAIEDYTGKKGFVIGDGCGVFAEYYLNKSLPQKLLVKIQSYNKNQMAIEHKIYSNLWLNENGIKKITNEINKNYNKAVQKINKRNERQTAKKQKQYYKAHKKEIKEEQKKQKESELLTQARDF